MVAVPATVATFACSAVVYAEVEGAGAPPPLCSNEGRAEANMEGRPGICEEEAAVAAVGANKWDVWPGSGDRSADEGFAIAAIVPCAIFVAFIIMGARADGT